MTNGLTTQILVLVLRYKSNLNHFINTNRMRIRYAYSSFVQFFFISSILFIEITKNVVFFGAS